MRKEDRTAPCYRVHALEDVLEERVVNEDVRVNATFEEAIDALTRPVEINYVPRPPRRG